MIREKRPWRFLESASTSFVSGTTSGTSSNSPTQVGLLGRPSERSGRAAPPARACATSRPEFAASGGSRRRCRPCARRRHPATRSRGSGRRRARRGGCRRRPRRRGGSSAPGRSRAELIDSGKTTVSRSGRTGRVGGDLELVDAPRWSTDSGLAHGLRTIRSARRQALRLRRGAAGRSTSRPRSNDASASSASRLLVDRHVALEGRRGRARSGGRRPSPRPAGARDARDRERRRRRRSARRRPDRRRRGRDNRDRRAGRPSGRRRRRAETRAARPRAASLARAPRTGPPSRSQAIEVVQRHRFIVAPTARPTIARMGMIVLARAVLALGAPPTCGSRASASARAVRGPQGRRRAARAARA